MRRIAFVLAALLAGCARLPVSEVEFQNAFEFAYRSKIDGPAEIPLAGRTTLRLQPGLAYIPPAAGERLLRAIGAPPPRKDMLGLVISAATARTYMAVVYARGRLPSDFPDVEIAGWRPAPDLAGFGPR